MIPWGRVVCIASWAGSSALSSTSTRTDLASLLLHSFTSGTVLLLCSGTLLFSCSFVAIEPCLEGEALR